MLHIAAHLLIYAEQYFLLKFNFMLVRVCNLKGNFIGSELRNFNKTEANFNIGEISLNGKVIFCNLCYNVILAIGYTVRTISQCVQQCFNNN